jgi:hypothetical protein
MGNIRRRRLVRDPAIPLVFRAWFEGTSSKSAEPLEFLVDGVTPKLKATYASWQAENPELRREPLRRFLVRHNAWDTGE